MIVILSGSATWSAGTFRRNKESFQNDSIFSLCRLIKLAQDIKYNQNQKYSKYDTERKIYSNRGHRQRMRERPGRRIFQDEDKVMSRQLGIEIGDYSSRRKDHKYFFQTGNINSIRKVS